MTDPERLALLEKQIPELHARCLLLTNQVNALHALLLRSYREHSEKEATPWPAIHHMYKHTVARETDAFLAAISDDRPALATRLRTILQEFLHPSKSDSERDGS